MNGDLVLVAYGYRAGELPLPIIKDDEVKEDLKITKPREIDLSVREPVQVSLGSVWLRVACPHACPRDPKTIIGGVRKRFAAKPPQSNRRLMRKFKRFVAKWLKKNLTPLSPEVDTSVETWLESTSYSRARKEELLRKWNACCESGGIRSKRRYTQCKSFMKDEVYPTFKHPRAINARADEFKCFSGPIFKLIEKQLFQHPAFIKRVPVADRPQYIRDRVGRNGARYIATDYTSFEALFTKQLMESCEFQLYQYMTQHLVESFWFRVIADILGGSNTCIFKEFVVYLKATRMSGEMCTSLGNGFSNLMFMLFVCFVKGCRNVVGVVEGDDGLFSMTGTPPTEEDFKELGLIIKAVVHDNLETASFCGLIFDPDDLVNISDPFKVLATFGWTTARYLRAKKSTKIHLLRAKALSILHQYSGCPVLQELGKYVLRCTANYGPLGASVEIFLRTQDAYHKSVFEGLIFEDVGKKSVPFNTRLLMQRAFGLSIESQLAAESYLRGLNTIQNLVFPWEDSVPVDQTTYWNRYVTWTAYKDIEKPAMVWAQMD